MDDARTKARRKAERQHSVITHGQLLECGLTPRRITGMLKRGELIGIHIGVYRFAGSSPLLETGVTAALLAAGPKAHLSHRVAAAVWNTPEFDLSAPELTTIGDPPKLAGVIAHRTTLGLTPLDVVTHGIWRVTRPALTLLQLGAVVDKDAVEKAVEHAVLTDVVSVNELMVVLERFGRPGVPGTATLRTILEARTESPESVLEWELLAIVRRYCSFEPTIQHPVTTSSGKRYRLDLSVPAAKVDIEGQSRRWHGTQARVASDMQRRNSLIADGWAVLEYGWADCKRRPKAIGREIDAVVASRLRLAS